MLYSEFRFTQEQTIHSLEWYTAWESHLRFLRVSEHQNIWHYAEWSNKFRGASAWETVALRYVCLILISGYRDFFALSGLATKMPQSGINIDFIRSNADIKSERSGTSENNPISGIVCNALLLSIRSRAGIILRVGGASGYHYHTAWNYQNVQLFAIASAYQKIIPVHFMH